MYTHDVNLQSTKAALAIHLGEMNGQLHYKLCFLRGQKRPAGTLFLPGSLPVSPPNFDGNSLSGRKNSEDPDRHQGASNATSLVN